MKCPLTKCKPPDSYLDEDFPITIGMGIPSLVLGEVEVSYFLNIYTDEKLA
ncbi:hypothetical protein POV26_06400 [Aequorivita todarodis]|uniref:hypothetical protein n=1 Tax=Aequorivita todarodis TaxID=2036821 RepID=UPI002350FC31|nr:hypothetical protein [Aequorivita todarodis]MDC8000659.1 hypothetical protein [Aequorivita todarodis]